MWLSAPIFESPAASERRGLDPRHGVCAHTGGMCKPCARRQNRDRVLTSLQTRVWIGTMPTCMYQEGGVSIRKPLSRSAWDECVPLCRAKSHYGLDLPEALERLPSASRYEMKMLCRYNKYSPFLTWFFERAHFKHQSNSGGHKCPLPPQPQLKPGEDFSAMAKAGNLGP